MDKNICVAATKIKILFLWSIYNTAVNHTSQIAGQHTVIHLYLTTKNKWLECNTSKIKLWKGRVRRSAKDAGGGGSSVRRGSGGGVLTSRGRVAAEGSSVVDGAQGRGAPRSGQGGELGGGYMERRPGGRRWPRIWGRAAQKVAPSLPLSSLSLSLSLSLFSVRMREVNQGEMNECAGERKVRA
uniref:Uncharacterized protein n=1 Tax=Arundo donax TaxID=35708 RepID=A0A0A9FA54_ARUDO